MDLTKDEVSESLRTFVSRRDALLHDDSAAFDYSLKRFVELCQKDPLAQEVLTALPGFEHFDVQDWWQQFAHDSNRHDGDLLLPDNADEELAARFHILASLANDPGRIWTIGLMFGKRKRDEAVELARNILIRPLLEELGNRIARTANLVTPHERALQAVPLNRLPRLDEVDIFLSHKSVDKPLVYRYYYALKELGFSPWLDETNMPAGANLERAVFNGLAQSCAAVFFITDNFKDEQYLASEVDYAILQKRKKGNKFAIITLRYSNAAAVPDLLTPYIYKTVGNDLDGFRELVRALPIELGPVRWKSEVVD